MNTENIRIIGCGNVGSNLSHILCLRNNDIPITKKITLVDQVRDIK